LKIRCAECGHLVVSVKTDDEAQKDVLEIFTRHFSERHPKQARELAEKLAMTMQLLATYFLIADYVDIPKEETVFAHTFELNETEIARLFGFEDESAPNTATVD
jgi:uncharacterized Zn finger protein (UPF0148 family)